MNTPPTPKRFDPEAWNAAFWENAGMLDGTFDASITNPDAAILFANFVTVFTELEHGMEIFAADLMGVERDIAALIMRSVVSIQGRISLMESLLTRANRNKDKSSKYEEILSEFKALKKIRNDFVHGRWRTNAQTREVRLIKLGGDPLVLEDQAAEPFNGDELGTASTRVAKLLIEIYEMFGPPRPILAPSRPTP